MLANQFKTLHTSIDKLFALFSEEPLSSKHIKAVQACSANIIGMVKDHPDALIAQAFVYRKSLSPIANLGYASAVMTLLLCFRHRWNATSSEQLVCAALTLSALHQGQLQQNLSREPQAPAPPIAPHRQMIKALERSGFKIWADGLKCAPNLLNFCRGSHTGWATWTSWQRLLACAFVLVIGQSPQRLISKMNWPSHLRRVLQSGGRDLADMISPLIDFISFFPPGLRVKTKDGNTLRLVSKGIECWYAQPDQSDDFIEVSKTDIVQVAPMGIIDEEQMDPIWGLNWEYFHESIDLEPLAPKRFAIDKPPGALMALQRELEAPEPDTQNVSRLLDKEPLFRQQLQRSATANARAHLPVTNSKHALMMHGMGRSKYVLLQEALLARLSQSHFPMQDALLSFCRLRNAAMSSISALLKGILTEELLSLATFSSASLFLHPRLKSLTAWPDVYQPSWNLFGLSDGPLYQELRQRSVLLAKAWQVDKQMLATLERRVKNKMGVVLVWALDVSELYAARFLLPQLQEPKEVDSLCQELLTHPPVDLSMPATQLEGELIRAMLCAHQSCGLHSTSH